MGVDFNADEIFEMAETMERNGAKFYRAAAKSIGSDLSRLFLELAAMEDSHLETFSRMRRALASEGKPPTEEAAAYLKALVGARVFERDPALEVSGKSGASEALRMALRLEEDSIAFYLGMKRAAPPRSGGEKIEKIIEEEMRHVALLAGRLAQMN